MQTKVQQDVVFALARKITDLLKSHPNPYEAEAACGMAKEMASCTVKQWPFLSERDS